MKYHKSKSYIKHATLAVGDLHISKDFYKDVMKLDVLSEDETRIVMGNQNQALVTLVQSNGFHIKQEGLYHIAFLLENEVQLANWLDSNRNYSKFVGASHHGVSKALYLEDPDGNGIEVYTDTDDRLWNRNKDEIQMVTQALDIQDLLSKANGDTKYTILIGHLHFQTKDVDELAAFYQNLGYNVTFDIGSATFMSFNGYHHHIAFNQWHKSSLGDHNEETTDIQEFEIWYQSKDMFDTVKDNLRLKNITFDEGHKSISLYDPMKIKVRLTY